jgi:hypothetical protein
MRRGLAGGRCLSLAGARSAVKIGFVARPDGAWQLPRGATPSTNGGWRGRGAGGQPVLLDPAGCDLPHDLPSVNGVCGGQLRRPRSAPEGRQPVARGATPGDRADTEGPKPRRGDTNCVPRRATAAPPGLGVWWASLFPGLTPRAVDCRPSGAGSVSKRRLGGGAAGVLPSTNGALDPARPRHGQQTVLAAGKGWA